MRRYNATCPHLVGLAAATLLILNLPAPAMATTQPSPDGTARTPSTVPAPAASPADAGAPAANAPAAASSEASEAPAKPKPQPPTLIARINLSTQTMTVQAGNKTIHTWKVSTGAPGYATPPGSFKPGWMAKDWRSRQYDDAPMPYSVFFNGGIAVHGTMNPGSLGRAASHGCVRLATSNAATFFKLVQRHGMAQTRIVVHGKQPFGNGAMYAARQGHRAANRARRSSGDWVYQTPRSAAPRGYRVADSYGYNGAPRAPRARSVRVQAPYWAQ